MDHKKEAAALIANLFTDATTRERSAHAKAFVDHVVAAARGDGRQTIADANTRNVVIAAKQLLEAVDRERGYYAGNRPITDVNAAFNDALGRQADTLRMALDVAGLR